MNKKKITNPTENKNKNRQEVLTGSFQDKKYK